MKRAAILILAVLLCSSLVSANSIFDIVNGNYKGPSYDLGQDRVTCNNGAYSATLSDFTGTIHLAYYTANDLVYQDGVVVSQTDPATQNRANAIKAYFDYVQKNGLCSSSASVTTPAPQAPKVSASQAAPELAPSTSIGVPTLAKRKAEIQNWEVTFYLDHDYWNGFGSLVNSANFTGGNVSIGMVCSFIDSKNGVCNSGAAFNLFSGVEANGQNACTIPMFFKMVMRDGKTTIENCIEIQKAGNCKNNKVLTSTSLPGCQTDQRYLLNAKKSTQLSWTSYLAAPFFLFGGVLSTVLPLYNPQYVGTTSNQKVLVNNSKVVSLPTSISGGRVFFRVLNVPTSNVLTPSITWTAKRTDPLTLVGTQTKISPSQTNALD